MDTSIKSQSQLAPVKQFNCTSCGNALEMVNPRARYIGCHYCGRLLDAESEEHQILKQFAESSRQKPMSFIKLGQTATIEGKKYQVIARTRWRMQYKEYWSEEGESGYSDETWVYDEWLMISPQRTYFYLVEDRDGYSVSEEIIPELPTLLTDNLRMRFYKSQRDSIVREYGSASVVYFEGESNYFIKPGDKIRFASFKQGRTDYIAEWRLEEGSNEIKEVEFFKEKPMRRIDLLEAFDENEAVGRLKEIEGKWRFVNRMGWLAGLLMLLMIIYSFAYDGKLVYEKSYSVSGLSSTQPVVSLPLTDPIDLPAGVPCRICVEAIDMPNGTEQFTFVYILNSDSVLINMMDGDMYFYTGYEDGEQWTEANQHTNKIFKLKEAGTYYIQPHVESAFANPGTIRVRVFEGVWLSRYFIFGLILSLIVAFFAWIKKVSAASNL